MDRLKKFIYIYLCSWVVFAQLSSCASSVYFQTDGSVEVDGTKTFVCGFYGHENREYDFLLMQESGFNLAHNAFFEKALPVDYSQSDVDELIICAGEFLDTANSYGLGVMLGLPVELVLQQDMANLSNYINALKDKNALWFWLLVDKPESQYYSQIRAVYGLIKTLDLSHPVILIDTVSGVTDLGSIGKECDSIWIDSRHIPFSQTAVADDISKVMSFYPSKTVWPVLQSQDYVLDIDRTGLYPFKLELNNRSSSFSQKSIRGQAHAAIAAGVKGLVYRLPPETLADYKESRSDLWDGFVRLGSELDELSDVLLSNDQVPSFAVEYIWWGRMQRIRDLYGNPDVNPAIGLPTRDHVLVWKRMHEGVLYVGFVADYMCLNRVKLYLPFSFARVIQHPGNQTIISSVPDSNPNVEWDKIPVAIWDIKDDDYVEFVIHEKDCLVWSFDAEPSVIHFDYNEDFTGINGSQPYGWTIYTGDLEIVNNQYVSNSSAGTTQTAFYMSDSSDKWSNYFINCDIAQTWQFPQTSTGSSSLYTSVLFRSQNNTDYYMVRIRKIAGTIYPKMEICRVTNTTSVYVMASTVLSDYFLANSWYNLNVNVDGSMINASLKKSNQDYIGSVSVSDSSYSLGTVGVSAVMSGSNSSKYDNLTITGERNP